MGFPFSIQATSKRIRMICYTMHPQVVMTVNMGACFHKNQIKMPSIAAGYLTLKISCMEEKFNMKIWGNRGGGGGGGIYLSSC